MEKFFRKDQVKVNDAGYLVDNEGCPIYNCSFNDEQEHIEKAVLLAEALIVRGHVSENKTVLKTNLAALLKEVYKDKTTHQLIQYRPLEKGTLSKQLAEESLNFIETFKYNESAEKINELVNSEFNNTLKFEEFGLTFATPYAMKLNKIYTIADLKSAFDVVMINKVDVEEFIEAIFA